jgi:transposase-like protein
MNGHGTKFGKKQGEAIVALLVQRNIEEAARAAGVSPSSLLRWMKQPEFQSGLREARRGAFSQAIARLQQASATAVSVVLKMMADPATPASVRLRAADSVLGHAAKAIEIEDIEARVTELERVNKQ